MKFKYPRITVAVLVLASALVVSAQPSDKANANRPPRDRQAPRLQDGLQPRGQLFPMMERVLTEEQRQSLRKAMDAQREKSRELEEKMRGARRDLFRASLTAEFDEEAIRAKALAVAKLDAELTVLRAKAFSQMKPALSTEQKEQLRNLGSDAENREGDGRRPNRGAPGERDANDLPPKPK